LLPVQLDHLQTARIKHRPALAGDVTVASICDDSTASLRTKLQSNSDAFGRCAVSASTGDASSASSSRRGPNR
jgi:hypothetical protein